VAYAAGRLGKKRVVVDGEEGKEYDRVDSPFFLFFSPDSKRVAYRARRGDKMFVVVDGEEGKEYDGVGSPFFSPDSRRVAYLAGRGDGDGDKMFVGFVVVDGEEGKEYDDFLGGGFFGGSELVFDSPKLLHALALRGDEFFRVEIEIVEE
jgi:hypothetical protein